jgi:hypothetical protein
MPMCGHLTVITGECHSGVHADKEVVFLVRLFQCCFFVVYHNDL